MWLRDRILLVFYGNVLLGLLRLSP
ncbi:MAG: hypothetical protein E7I95_08420 [Haemophilus parahaemolyticus]|nr:hypothetical protein [Haemophilus parahaemolyticus]MDU4465436.1 hypothetical protein [Haemophilus parahaemolyticus]